MCDVLVPILGKRTRNWRKKMKLEEKLCPSGFEGEKEEIGEDKDVVGQKFSRALGAPRHSNSSRGVSCINNYN